MHQKVYPRQSKFRQINTRSKAQSKHFEAQPTRKWKKKPKSATRNFTLFRRLGSAPHWRSSRTTWVWPWAAATMSGVMSDWTGVEQSTLWLQLRCEEKTKEKRKCHKALSPVAGYVRRITSVRVRVCECGWTLLLFNQTKPKQKRNRKTKTNEEKMSRAFSVCACVCV